MPTEIPADQVQLKCGCGRVFRNMNAVRGHQSRHTEPACREPFTYLMAGKPASEPERQPSGSREFGSNRQEADPEDLDPEDDQRPAAARSGSQAAVDPPFEPARKPISEWGLPEPSRVPERGIQFPVMIRFAYDSYRVKVPGYKKSLQEWVYDMLELAMHTMGMHPATIWTKPLAPPPPEAMVAYFDPALHDSIVEEVTHDAA